ncbi:MAG: hypothetical protein M1837_004163 [Sclerophora amabilis]|nr:MAG: hypothetical protein M1837_004163 [Sclerophora amabilis]
MPPKCPLPISDSFDDVDAYINSLLAFTTSSSLFQTLCGGVHVLDFFTREPDLYSTVLPATWRHWFNEHNIEEILNFLLRVDLDQCGSVCQSGQSDPKGPHATEVPPSYWSGKPLPPKDLCEYIQNVRRHSLTRQHRASEIPRTGRVLARNVCTGMKPKKIHEVECFAQYVDNLASAISDKGQRITHLVDFGSGQNYLGRALASQPYNRNIIAVEGKMANITGARSMDVKAKLVKKERPMRDKKGYRQQDHERPPHPITDSHDSGIDTTSSDQVGSFTTDPQLDSQVTTNYFSAGGTGSIQYVEHTLVNGDLSKVVQRQGSNEMVPASEGEVKEAAKMPQLSQKLDQIVMSTLEDSKSSRPGDHGSIEDQEQQKFMVISLHSCGNLLHHGIKSLLLNQSVMAVAVVGCCYNLVTERLGPRTFKLPNLRSYNARVEREGTDCDPHGFPMSEKLATYRHGGETGVRLNITARMMALQAPENWTKEESDAFFTRHYFRALLQRIFADRGAVERVSAPDAGADGRSPTSESGTDPIIIGSLRKACYRSFTAYVRGALAKLLQDPVRRPHLLACMGDIADTEIEEYERRFREKKKNLCIIWSLMAFSAGLVEAVIVVDRWLFLREHPDQVKDCWVEPVFDYKQSPRNLVVVGIKR